MLRRKDKKPDSMPQTETQVAATISRIIDSADDGGEVIISSGKLDHRCYDNDDVVDAVQKAQERKVRFIVVTGPDIDAESVRFIDLLQDSIRVAPTTPSYHFAVANCKNFRFERQDMDEHGESENIERWNDPVNGKYLKLKVIQSLSKTQHYKDFIKSKAGAVN